MDTKALIIRVLLAAALLALGYSIGDQEGYVRGFADARTKYEAR